jgi:hypothetical protein
MDWTLIDLNELVTAAIKDLKPKVQSSSAIIDTSRQQIPFV